ncbi:MAG: A/G-specific adenine glycosylase, partial [Pseudomonadota bacterium]|nr:A/G-specific adenine glycosylase [Pseudomonadota bacterium]
MDCTITQAPIRVFHRRLRRWYAAHGRRNLPWRNTHDPYAIYVSEVMLQQTQVATVLDRYYFPFLKRFPTIRALAAARQDEVLSAWQGLGYYSRAVHLHKAARRCKDQFPRRIEDMVSLPGVGRNTAHAIAAFAYRQPVAVMEANVRRVLSRIFALKQPNEAELWEKAATLLDENNPFDYNQAMMDLGALVCVRRAPLCPQCPASAICKGKASPGTYPAPKAKKPVPVRRKHIVVLKSAEGKYFATPRKGKFLNGLYHFVENENVPPSGTKIGHIRRQYSHFTLEADVWLAKARETGEGWHSLKQLKKLP